MSEEVKKFVDIFFTNEERKEFESALQIMNKFGFEVVLNVEKELSTN